jgi:hypothetical protein
MRPGVKTKMAVNRRKVVQDLEYLRDEARRVNDASSRMDAENWLKRVRARDLKEQDWLEAADAVSQISAVLNSRPGAKAKMDKNADYVEYANLRETLSKLENRVRRAQGEERARLQRELDAGTKRFRELGNRLRAARPGAKATHAAADKPGRKVMAESDPAVSAKIRKLMAEGKPQKQAVAIALDMKRRGEI